MKHDYSDRYVFNNLKFAIISFTRSYQSGGSLVACHTTVDLVAPETKSVQVKISGFDSEVMEMLEKAKV